MRSRILLSMAVGFVALALLGVTAHAQPTGSDGTVPANLNGPCEVFATISGSGATVDPAASGGVYTVPIDGSASYNGSIAVPAEERPVNGSVWVVTPPGFPSITIRSWDDPYATTVSDAGSVSWSLPGALPRGIELTVEGFHNDAASCDGSIVVKLEGGPLDSPVGVASVVLTFVTAGGLLFVAVPVAR